MGVRNTSGVRKVVRDRKVHCVRQPSAERLAGAATGTKTGQDAVVKPALRRCPCSFPAPPWTTPDDVVRSPPRGARVGQKGHPR